MSHATAEKEFKQFLHKNTERHRSGVKGPSPDAEYRFARVQDIHLIQYLEQEYEQGYIPERTIYTSPSQEVYIMFHKLPTTKENTDGQRDQILHD